MTQGDNSKLQNLEFIATLLGSTLLMGSSFVAGKVLLQDAFTPLTLVGWRFVAAAAATLPLVFLDNRNLAEALFPRKAGHRDALLIILVGLVQTAAVMGLLFLAMRSVTASTAAILLFTNPIWVALFGRFFLGERLHGVRLLGLVLGIVGVCCAIGLGPEIFSGGKAAVGELIGLSSALCWAAATIINKKASLPIGSWALSFWQMLIGGFAVLFVAHGLGEHWPRGVTAGEWAWFLWLAIPASTGSFGLWFVALAKGGATRASSYLFLAPVFTVIFSFFVFGTTVSWLQAFGGGAIAVALWLVNRGDGTANRSERLREALAEGRP